MPRPDGQSGISLPWEVPSLILNSPLSQRGRVSCLLTFSAADSRREKRDEPFQRLPKER
jgi:hypothetical protein